VELFIVDTFAFANSNGQQLIDAAIDWALGIQTVTQPQMTVSRNANGEIVIAWTNGGTLEWTSSLTPGTTWTALPNAPNPYTEATTQTMRFYRVRK
jgi:hypothetical protein